MSALTKIRVLELAEGVAAEYCGKLLADFGAEIIKIEKPDGGSLTRHMGPFAHDANAADGEHSGLFAYLNTNKHSVALDVHSDAGMATLTRLLGCVDVVISDAAHSWLDSLGLSPDACAQHFPQLLVCSISSFGRSVTGEELLAEDINVFHASGWGFHTPTGADVKRPPLSGAGRFITSYEAGLEAAMCITSCLYERIDSGLGQYIDISKQAVLAGRTDYVLGQMIAGDMDVSNNRGAYDLAGPAGIFPASDGFVYIWMSAPGHWTALAELLGQPEWMNAFPPNWLERECTPERVAVVRQHVGAWLKTQPKAAVAERAQKLGLILVPVSNAADLQASPQYQYRGFFSEVEHPVLGRVSYPTVPYQLSETPARITEPAPLLGQHTEQVLAAILTSENVTASQLAASKAASSNATTSKPASNRGGPLQGLRVVELTKVWAGPYIGKMLGFLGAEVIRVESLGSLDVTRTYGVEDINNAPGFKAVNPQKLSVQIDMKKPDGIKLLLDLLAEADVVVENLRPGAIDRLGLGYESVKKVNPEIVYVSMGMYGASGPLAYQTGYAPCFAALGGLSALVGYEGESPAGMNVRYADSTFGTVAAYAAVVALLHRRRTGKGQFIDVSAVETMTTMIGDAVMEYSLNGVVAEAAGNRHNEMAPHGVYPCRDGEWLSIAARDDSVWTALATAIGKPELAAQAQFSTLAARKANEEALDQLIADWTAVGEAAELAALLQAAGVAAVKSQSSLDMIADQNLWLRGFYQDVTDQAGNNRLILGPAWKMSRMAAVVDDSPRLGQHNSYVFGEILGLSDAEQQVLTDTQVTR